MTGDETRRDLETARRRSIHATVATVAGVGALGVTALVMLNAVDPVASAPKGWAIAFFGSAQVTAVALGSAMVSAVTLRRDRSTAADVVLLCRRNGIALAAAFVTLLTVGAALPGEASAWVVLGGPVLAVLAAVVVGRSWTSARRLDRDGDALTRLPLGVVTVLVTVALAAVGAFAWDLLDHGTLVGSAAAAGVETALVLLGLAVLGRPLGLVLRARPTEVA